MTYETIIGLEVHAQVNTKTKMFCGCDNDAWGKAPNTTVCPVCMGFPGTLPVPNKVVIEKAVGASVALKCTVNESSHFDRKNYFYPDLPSGFQISQYKHPLSSNGIVKFSITDPKTNTSEQVECRILRLHLENDAGKLTHMGRSTLCDYNRSGTPLMEIVTEPDLRSPRAAACFAEELRRILIASGASEADMFKGMMRFDASISLRPKGEKKLYPRIEIKNLNSFKMLERALNYEENELKKLWEEGKAPTGETTVAWRDDEGKTELLRDKESAADYRYFPEPDIPPMHLTRDMIASLSSSTSKLPSEMKDEYMNMGLTAAEATMLTDNADLRERFDAIKETTGDAKRASSIVLTQMTGFLAKHNKSEAPSAKELVELVEAMKKGEISTTIAKDVLEKMITTGKSASEIIKDEGMGQISDTGTLEKLLDDAIKANPKAIESYKGGKATALGAIVGAVMKASKGQADAAKVQQMLLEKIN